jgi:SAM-dependent methyltransferase
MGLLKSLYLWWKERHFRKLKSKRLEEIFTEIYEKNIWGGKPGTFYSGTGTENPSTEIYIAALVRLINEERIQSVLDIGCGDFRIMNQVIAKTNISYLGIDVVAPLVNDLERKFATDRVKFSVLNAVNDPLPSAELVTIRQVLQHLNNAQIQSILNKVSKFKYALITEHVPIGESVEPNLDKIAGPHIRMRVNSGVFIDQPPFSMKNVKVLFEYREDDPVKGKMVPAVIRSYFIDNTAS